MSDETQAENPAVAAEREAQAQAEAAAEVKQPPQPQPQPTLEQVQQAAGLQGSAAVAATTALTASAPVAVTPLAQAEAILFGVAPQLAEIGINGALGAIPGGATWSPLADEVFGLVIQGLFAKLSPTKQAAVTAALPTV